MESLVPEQLYFLLHLSNLLAREQASTLYKDSRKQENQRSNPAVTSPGPNTNPLYKGVLLDVNSIFHTRVQTELCRSWEESGGCRYGSKCQFAHGPEDLRPAQRHPKYKTETCHMFATTGTCAYGARCRFLHKRVTKRGEAKEARGPAGGGGGSWPEQSAVHAPPSSPMPSSPAVQAPLYCQHPFAASLPTTPSLPYLHSLAAQAVLHKGPTSPTTVLDCPTPSGPEWPPLQGSTEHGGLRASLKLAPLSLAVLDSFGSPVSPSAPARQYLARNTTSSAFPRCTDDSFAPLPPTLSAADALRPYCSSESLRTSQQGSGNAAPTGSDRAVLSLASSKPCAGDSLAPLSGQCSSLESARRLPIFKCLAIDSSEQRP